MPLRHLLLAALLLQAGGCAHHLFPVAQTGSVPQGVGPDPVAATPVAPTRRGPAANAVDPYETLRQSAADRRRWSDGRPAQ